MKTVIRAVIGIVLCGLAISVSAENDFTSRWYGGIGAGISELDPDPNGTPVTVDESRSSGGKVFLGYDLTKRFSIEGHYADLGKAKMSPQGEVKYKELALGGLYYLYKQREAHTGFGLFAKGGLGKMENDTDLPYERVNDFSFFYGAGLEYAFKNGVALRGELDLYDRDARFLTVSLLKRFGGATEEKPASSEPAPEPVVIAPAPVSPELVLEPESEPVAPLGELEIIYFDTNSAELTSKARAKLDHIAGELQRIPDASVEVQGHTDNRATDRYNKALSQRRASSVIDYLTRKKGIASSRLLPEAYGETKPAASNATRQGMSLNRRVQFKELN